MFIRNSWLVVTILCVFLPGALRAGIKLGFPHPWPSYYDDALRVDGEMLSKGMPVETDGVHRSEFRNADGDLLVVIEYVPCEEPACDGMYGAVLQDQNEKLPALGGTFLSVSDTDFAVKWPSDDSAHLVLFGKLPAAVVAWERIAKVNGDVKVEEEYLAGVRSVLDRQRFEEAVDKGNVELGRWEKEIHRYAKGLLVQGRKEEALGVLTQVITWAPANYEAQLDFAENTPDEKAAQASALTVWENAETSGLTERSARLLGHAERLLESLPVIKEGLHGLQLVLVPLPRCDIRLVEAAGDLYEQKFDVPVTLARLPMEWIWNPEDRFYGQRDMERMIRAKAGTDVQLEGKNREHYALELIAAYSEAEPLVQYQVRKYLAETADRPGQYEVSPYVERLSDMLKSYRSDDERTMIVGVTASDIYKKDANYVFSSGLRKDGRSASILSYANMQATSLNETFESRQRVVERIAKELVPASFQQLGIPRPVDPTDPYSYSSGTERLEQKSLTLSRQTQEALDQFRTPKRQK